MIIVTIVDEARNIGRDHGRNAASWFFDGNTDRDTYAAFRRGLEEGDPATEDQLPAADLSGQYADGYTLRDLLADVGVDDADEEVDIDDLVGAYEEGFADAVRADIERQISIQLDGDDQRRVPMSDHEQIDDLLRGDPWHDR